MPTENLLKRCARPDTLILSVGTVLAATAVARLRGEMEVLQGIFCLFFAVSTQLMANFAHRYFNLKHHYGANMDDRIYKRQLNPEIEEKVSCEGYKGMMLISVTIGLSIVSIFDGWWMLIVGALVYALSLLSNFGRQTIFRSALSPLVPFLLFGVIGVGGGTLVQTTYDNPNPFDWYYVGPALIVGIAMGFFASNVLLLHSYTNVESDRENNLQSFATRFGIKGCRILIFVNGTLAVAILTIFVFTQHLGEYSPLISSTLVCKCLALIPVLVGFLLNVMILTKTDNHGRNGIESTNLSMYNFLLVGFLMFVISFIIGDPDRSRVMFIN